MSNGMPNVVIAAYRRRRRICSFSEHLDNSLKICAFISVRFMAFADAQPLFSESVEWRCEGGTGISVIRDDDVADDPKLEFRRTMRSLCSVVG